MKHLKSPILSAVAFFGTLGMLSIGYSAYVSSYPATATNATQLSSSEWNKMVTALQTLDTNLSVFGISWWKVGIGTNSPIWPFQVNADGSANNAGITVNTYQGASIQRYFRSNGTNAVPSPVSNGDQLWALNFSWFWSGKPNSVFVNGDARAGISIYANENWSSANNNGTSMRFYTTSNGSNTTYDRMTIDQNGYVGIGTTAPAWHLEVAGNVPNGYVGITNNNAAAGGGKWTWLNGSTGSPLGAGKMCFENGGVCRFGLDGSGNATAATFNGVSDSRYKTNVSTASGLETVAKLRGVEFDWKNGNGKSSGVIAQELETVLPHLVATDSSPEKMKSVNYAGLSAYFIESIKELKARNEALEAKNAEMEKRLEALEAAK